MYLLDGHNLADFGIIAGQADNNNIAIVGAADMPVRTGKTFHEWHDCIEPYLRLDEIFFAGRDIYFTFLLEANSKKQAIEKIYSFYDLLTSFDELKTFSTEYFGDLEVYVKNEIKIEYLGAGWCKGLMTFRQPVVDLNGDEIIGDNQSPNIDGVSFAQLGITILKTSGEINRPSTKDSKVIIYGKEGFNVTKQSFRTISLNLLIEQPNIAAFNSAIKSLTALLASPNARILNHDGYARECFAKDGFKLTSIYKQGDAFIGIIDLNLTEIRVLTDYNVLSDGAGNILTDGNGVPLSEIFKQQ